VTSGRCTWRIPSRIPSADDKRNPLITFNKHKRDESCEHYLFT
jgi:hypothetical protein